jgi:hypothetical protein
MSQNIEVPMVRTGASWLERAGGFTALFGAACEAVASARQDDPGRPLYRRLGMILNGLGASFEGAGAMRLPCCEEHGRQLVAALESVTRDGVLATAPDCLVGLSRDELRTVEWSLRVFASMVGGVAAAVGTERGRADVTEALEQQRQRGKPCASDPLACGQPVS